MGMVIEQRTQLLQTLGTIGASAADAATEGIAEAIKTDSKTVETAIKLFGGFDRSEFEGINGSNPNLAEKEVLLVPAVRPPASYEGPADYFKPLSSTIGLEGLLVSSQDLLRQLQDPQFRMSDGLSAFSDHKITQALLQNALMPNLPVPEDGKGQPVPEDGKSEPVPDDGKFLLGRGIASLADFGKLFLMENTAQKQLQLHQQLDVGASSGFGIPKQVAQPGANRSKLNPGLKGMPDAETVTPQSEALMNLPLDHALNGTPATVGEFRQMIDVLQDEVTRINTMNESNGPFRNPFVSQQCSVIQQQLKLLKEMYQNAPPDSAPNPMSLQYLQMIRQAIKQLPPSG